MIENGRALTIPFCAVLTACGAILAFHFFVA